jgi:hypothetical protein
VWECVHPVSAVIFPVVEAVVAATIWDGSDYCLVVCHVTRGAHVESARCVEMVEIFCVD